ncbi:MAG TPA: response regulator [Polyangia bacterium]
MSLTDAQILWSRFVVELGEGAIRLGACAAHSAAPPVAELAALAGDLFELRAACALMGVEPGVVAAGYAEALVRAVLAGRSWSEVQGALAELGAALTAGARALENPDLSGARIEDLDAIRDALAHAASLLPEPPSPSENIALERPASPQTDDALWVPQVDEDMIDPFLEEAAERIEALSQKLLRLESSPADGELVREIFRDLHTVKGSSGFVGLKRMNRLAHAAEELIGQVRSGARPVERPLIDALLGALDGLKAILAAAAGASGPSRLSGVRIEVSIDDLLAQLRAPGAPRAAPPPMSPVEIKPADARQTLRVDFEKLDALLNLVGELLLSRARLHGSVASLAALSRELDGQLRRARRGAKTPSAALLDDLDRFGRIQAGLASDLTDGAGQLDHVAGELRQQVMKLRMLPIGRVFNKYHRTVRELAHQLGKQVRLEIEGADTELDKVLLEQLDDPLLHLLRNALDHGVEEPEARAAAQKPPEGVITLRAQHRGNQIAIEIADDGAGIDPQKLRDKARSSRLASEDELAQMDDKQVLDLIFRPGFSTAARVTDLSGRGVGMDVVRAAVSRLSGSIEIASEPGRGTTFTLKLPLTLAIIQVLLVRAAGEDLALPLDCVVRSLACRPEELHRLYDRELLVLSDGEQVPLLRLAEVLELGGPRFSGAELPVVLVEAAGEIYGLAIDRLVGKQEIVLKTLGGLLEEVPCAAGATLIGDRVALILDVVEVVQRGLRRHAPAMLAPLTDTPEAPARARPRVLLAEDSEVVREAMRRALEACGCEVVTARDGTEALLLAERDPAGFDLISTDVMMPGKDGYELTRALRADPRHKDVPIVMVTSRSEHLDRVRGFDAGVDEYLVKPLDQGELERAIDRHLGRHLGRPLGRAPGRPGTLS